MTEELFRPIFVPDELREAVSGRAWLQAMLDAERALAVAEARAGLIPREAAEAIASRCDASREAGLLEACFVPRTSPRSPRSVSVG